MKDWIIKFKKCILIVVGLIVLLLLYCHLTITFYESIDIVNPLRSNFFRDSLVPIITSFIAFGGVTITVWAGTRNQLKKKEIEQGMLISQQKKQESEKIQILVSSILNIINQLSNLYTEAIKLEVRIGDEGYEDTKNNINTVRKEEITEMNNRYSRLNTAFLDYAHDLRTFLWSKNYASNAFSLCEMISIGMSYITTIIDPKQSRYSGEMRAEYIKGGEEVIITTDVVKDSMRELNIELERILKSI